MKIKPLPGFMVVKLEALYKDDGLIKIPERYKKAPHLIGRIEALSMRLEDMRTLGTELSAGDRIIVTPLGGRNLGQDDLYVYPISLMRKDERGRKYRDSGILAITDNTVDLSAHSQEIERCQWCGDVNHSKQNMIMVDGTCPRCHKDRYGVIPDNSIKVTDADLANFEHAKAS